ncbi:MAG: 30S ribosomal protein S21 [Verrucomicrobiota bacterium]|nr:30S ribosomal protein S21 [Verrucomicrobiota bacterium]
MSSVKVRIGEPIDRALRALKKKLDKEGTMKAAKAHRFYDKPSVKSRLKSKAAAKRARIALRRGG